MRNFAKRALARTLFAVYRALDPLVRFREAAILCYHSISADGDMITIPPELFGAHLAALRDAGYAFVSLDDIVAYLSGRVLEKKVVALTFDDGYEDFATTVVPILEKMRIPAAVFVVADEAAARGALGNDLPLMSLETIARLGSHPLVTVGYHGHAHADLRRLDQGALPQEVAPRHGAQFFAYPGGNYSDPAMRAVRDAGYRAAFSIKPTLATPRADRYLLPRTVVMRDTDIRFAVSRAAAWYRAFTRRL